MLFSSNIFLFVFLPIVIIGYFGLMRGRKLKNLFLLGASLFFYAWGEPWFVFIMMASILVNYIFALLIDKFKEKTVIKRLCLILDLVFNMGLFFVFKYLMFAVENVNLLFQTDFSVGKIVLPIGISFFTFQALSYVLDVYTGKVAVQKSVFKVGLYIALFPQLIAGPIVRYETIAEEIDNRKETLKDFSEGIIRFIYGLGKKVILSNSMAIIAEQAFNSAPTVSNISVAFAILGALAYTFQIYFDFSGYSDMAIGLGRMFGFHFLENFNYPYISKSVSEFWRRWHISLGTWFKDYVYIPLGGSRVKMPRLILNLFIVWSLTGIWHGANWTFLIWGLWFFVLLTIEKITGVEKKLKKLSFLKYIYTFTAVVIGWIFFRSKDIFYAIDYIKRIVTFENFVDNQFFRYLIEYKYIWILVILLSTPIYYKIKEKYREKMWFKLVELILCAGIMMVCVSYIAKGSYNPFIYFNF